MNENENMDDSGSWLKKAFNQILGSIYSHEIKEKELDKLIEGIAYYAIDKLNIEEKDFNWQSVEKWHYKEQNNLVDYYLDFPEIKKIIFKARVSSEYDWEDICSKEMPIARINQKILSTFKKIINNEITCYSREELIRKYNFVL